MSRKKQRPHVIPINLCPSCGARFSRASGLNHMSAPKPGDVTICISCGTVLCFDETLRTKLAKGDDLADLEPEQVDLIQRAQALIRARLAAEGAR